MDSDKLYQIIENHISIKEDLDVEFKSAKGGFPGSFWETYSAFANTEGGIIVFGVKENNGDFIVNTLNNDAIDKYKKDFWSAINNKNTVNRNLLVDSDVIDITYDGNRLLAFHIPQADRSQRPVYKGLDPYNGTFKRNYEGDYKCTEDEVRRMYADADVNRPADSRILPDYTLADIDHRSLEQFRRLFSISKPDHPWLVLDDIQLLTKLGGYRIDRKTKQEGFTVAGILMFGKTESITDIECLPHFFPDYRLYANKNTTGTERWIDRVCPDGTWEANLFQFYRLVLPKLTSALPRPFQLDEDTRIDETTAHIALREALINLCIHADHSVNASLTIRQYPQCIIMSNPGTLLISRSQYYIGGESVCRNKALQTMFTMFGKAEKAGSGTDKILQGWHDQNWKIPQLQLQRQPDKVELYLSLESILPDCAKEKLINIFGKGCLKWERNKLLAMSIACTEGEINNESLQFILSAHRTEITELLRNLKAEGLLDSEGYGRGTHYHIPSSIMNIHDREQNLPSSEQNLPSHPQKEIDPTKHYKKEEAFNLILSYCMVYRSAESIANYLGRNIKYVQTTYIKPLENNGLLVRLYPEKSHHPYQKYKIKEQE